MDARGRTRAVGDGNHGKSHGVVKLEDETDWRPRE
jgi:hypothetical protein